MKSPSFAAVLLIGALVPIGCGAPSANVKGQVTCDGKPIVGTILFSPKGGEGTTTGTSVSASLNDDGRYELKLKSIGKYTVVITPGDVKFRPKAGGLDYPCDRSPLERDITAGDNDITIELAKRTR
jgi:hypothetical protein